MYRTDQAYRYAGSSLLVERLINVLLFQYYQEKEWWLEDYNLQNTKNPFLSPAQIFLQLILKINMFMEKAEILEIIKDRWKTESSYIYGQEHRHRDKGKGTKGDKVYVLQPAYSLVLSAAINSISFQIY